jgi:hypothetical protein
MFRFAREKTRGKPTRPVGSHDLHGLLHRVPHVLAASQLGTVVLLDTKRETYHALNEVGSRVWDLLRTGPTLQVIVRAIRDEYDAPDTAADQIERDIAGLLIELKQGGLIYVTPHIPSPDGD